MLGENVVQSLQKLITLSQRLDDLVEDVREFRETAIKRLDEHDSRLRNVEVAIARLDAERAGLADKAAAAAETAVTKVIADLRVRYVEEQAQRRQEPPELAGGERR
jgi:hypothetical protein